MGADDDEKLSTASNSSARKRERRHWWVKFGLIGGITFVWFGSGVWLGCLVEGWRFVTSLYVMVQILTTIGYGDITFETEAMKIIMTIYVLFGCLIVAGLVSSIAQEVLSKQEKVLRRQMRKVEARMHGTHYKDKQVKEAWQAFNKVFVTAIMFGVFLAAGTVFYALYENCTCSYGRPRIEGCIDGEKCEFTGGATKTWIDSFYMSVITLTTVGFGDHSPKSYWGRWFGILWMTFGVFSCANFIGAFSGFFLAAEKQIQADRIDKETFDSIADKDGKLKKLDFRAYLLVKLGLVQKQDIDHIDSIFSGINTSKDGKITYMEIEKYFEDQN